MAGQHTIAACLFHTDAVLRRSLEEQVRMRQTRYRPPSCAQRDRMGAALDRPVKVRAAAEDPKPSPGTCPSEKAPQRAPTGEPAPARHSPRVPVPPGNLSDCTTSYRSAAAQGAGRSQCPPVHTNQVVPTSPVELMG